jgi:hypothetical protein
MISSYMLQHVFRAELVRVVVNHKQVRTTRCEVCIFHTTMFLQITDELGLFGFAEHIIHVNHNFDFMRARHLRSSFMAYRQTPATYEA